MSSYGSLAEDEITLPNGANRKRPRKWLVAVGVTCCAAAATAAVTWATGGSSNAPAGTSLEHIQGGDSSPSAIVAQADVPQHTSTTWFPTTSAPHVVMVLADDQGYNDIGYQSNDLAGLTPTLDALSADGVRLTSYYAQHLCTPARGALMTGKYPIHTGLQHDVIHIDAPWGLPLEHKLMPEHLSAAGYATHMLGKWHLGHFAEDFLPHKRGFDSFFGYVADTQDPFTHRYPADIDGVSMSDLMSSNRNGDITFEQREGEYDAIMFTERATDLIAHHDTSMPLFLYLAHQNTHAPLVDLPDEWFSASQHELFNGIADDTRRNFAKSLAMLDQAVLNLTTALQQRDDMWNNTLLIYSSDNGGCHKAGAYNYPLRGQKYYFYEGGLKVPAFIGGGVVPEQARGVQFDGLVHVTDWLPTILALAGQSSLSNLDGVNQWAALTSSALPPRSELLYNIDPYLEKPSGSGPDVLVTDEKYVRSALRVGDWKLVLDEFCVGYFDPTSQEEYTSLGKEATCNVTTCANPDESEPRSSFLFNLATDPNETTNLIDTYPAIAKSLESRIHELAGTMVASAWHSIDISAYSAWGANKNHISPWL